MYFIISTLHSGFAIASIDGRVGMEYMDQSKKGFVVPVGRMPCCVGSHALVVWRGSYAFRCHRKKDKGTGLEQVYPVNALAFNPV